MPQPRRPAPSQSRDGISKGERRKLNVSSRVTRPQHIDDSVIDG